MAGRCKNCRQVVKGDHNIVTCGREPAPIPTARVTTLPDTRIGGAYHPMPYKEPKSSVTDAYQKFKQHIPATVSLAMLGDDVEADFWRAKKSGSKLDNPVLLDLNKNLGLELGNDKNDVPCPYCGRERGPGHERYTQCPQRVIVSEPDLDLVPTVGSSIVSSNPAPPVLDEEKVIAKAIALVEWETFPAYEQWVGNQFAGSLGEDEGSGFEQATVYAATPAGEIAVQNLINTPGIPSHLVEKLELLQQTALFEGKTELEVLLFQKRAYMLADAPIEQYEQLDKILGEQLADQKAAVETVLQAHHNQNTVVGRGALVEDSVCSESYIEQYAKVSKSTILDSEVRKGAKISNSIIGGSSIRRFGSVSNSTVNGSIVLGSVLNSTILDSKITPYAEISNSIISNASIRSKAKVSNSVINGSNVEGSVDDCTLGAGVRVGSESSVVGIKVDVGTFGGDARVRGPKDVQQFAENGTVYTRYRNNESGKFRNRYTYTSARFDALTGKVVSDWYTPEEEDEDKFVRVESNPEQYVVS